jgi:hypothetical protein
MRLHQPLKYKKGERYSVLLSKKRGEKPVELGVARIEFIQVITFNTLNPIICGIDTGYSTEETKKIFKRMYRTIDFDKQYLDLILLKYVERQEQVEIPWSTPR